MLKKLKLVLIPLISGVLVVLALLLLSTNQNKDNLLKVYFLNVGQGDAIFIESPNGNKMLIDGGRTDNKVLKELVEIIGSDRKINVVLATHPDADHIGGLPEIFKRYDVDLFLTSQSGKDTKVSDSLFEEYRQSEALGYFARRGMRLTLDEERGVFADILFPDRNVDSWESNSASVILKLTYGGKSFIFTGDSPTSIEQFLVNKDREDIDVDILKLGHHGSKTSSGEQFLRATSPDIAIISVGKNSYGHPYPEVMNRLKRLKIDYLSTQEEGTISFVTDGQRISLQK